MDDNSLRRNLISGLLFLFFISCTNGNTVRNLLSGVRSVTGVDPKPDTTEEEKEICFDHLGCFSLDKPWKSFSRPVPTPWRPNDILPSVALYTRGSNSGFNVSLEDPDLSVEDSDFNPQRPTTIITHGFASDGQADWLHDMKDGYLKNVDANVFILDWGKGAKLTNYLQVASNTRIVGAQLARFVRYLISTGLTPKNIHLIGHSLGSHIMSYCAKNISDISKINRITALDPAQPAFEGTPEKIRLAKSDAENVDVIHTDAKPFIPFLGFGMMSPVGTVDFYLNGGSWQPGCFSMDTPNITSLSDLLEYPCEVVSKWVSCSHGRSYEYFIASLNSNNCSFCGRKMKKTETFLKISTLGRLSLADPLVKEISQCTKDTCNILGLETFTLPSRGSFAVTTDDDPPYCELKGEKTRRLRSLLSLGYNQISRGLSYVGKKLRII